MDMMDTRTTMTTLTSLASNIITTPSHLNLTTVAQEVQDNNDNLIYSVRNYMLLTIFLFGIPGNIISVKIMRGKGFNKMAHSIICAALGIVNALYLICTLPIVVLEIYWEPNFISIKLCRFTTGFGNFCGHLDSALLTFLTYERVIAIFFPFNISQIVTKFRVKIGITIIVIFYLLLDSVFCLRMDVHEVEIENSTFEICDMIHNYGLPEEVFEIWYLITEMLAVAIPWVLIFVGNIAIIIKLYREKVKRQELGLGNRSGQGDNSGRATLMIIVVTVAYLILTLPLSVYYFIHGVDSNFFSDPVWNVCYIIVMINPAINCYLWVLSGSQFRKQFKELILQCVCRR